MAHEPASTNSQDRYGKVGDEVASVLASARTASVEVRNQAIRYAESLVESAREEIAEMRREADAEANRTVGKAEMRARSIMQDARRQVLAIIESAHARVAEAEAAERAAEERKQALLVQEAEIIERVTAAAKSVEARIDELKAAGMTQPVDETPTPIEQIEEMLLRGREETDLGEAPHPEV